MKVKVIKIFLDKYTKVPYSVGQEIHLEDENRVEDLVARGLVEIVEEKSNQNSIILFDQKFDKKNVLEALKSIGEKASLKMKDETIIDNVEALSQDQLNALQIALGIQKCL